MKKVIRQSGGRRSVRSILLTALTLGACSTIMTTGVLFAVASPASAAQATQLAFTTQPPTTTVAGATLASFEVLIEDGTNAPATTNLTDSITISSSCALGGTTVATASGGTATFNALVIDTGTSCTLTATDTSTTLSKATSTSVTVRPSTANKVSFTTQPPTTANESAALATFKVSVEDSFGNVVTTGTGATDDVAITSSCTLGGTRTATAVAGVATFSALAVDDTGACTLTAKDSSRNLTAATSTSVSVSVGSAGKLAFTTQPSKTGNAGSALATFRVSVEDASDNVIATGTGATDVVTITSSCTLGGTVSATAVAGVAAFDALAIDSARACTLTATDTSRSLTVATSTAVTVSPDTATKLDFTTEPPATASVGAVLSSFQVSVEDAYGNVVTSGNGAKDTLTITSTCALGGTATASAVAGVATFTSLSLNSAGTCTLTATNSSRVLTVATSSVIDSRSAQGALNVTSLTGTFGKSLTLKTSGGTGAGAVTFSVTNGTATGCSVSGSSLTASSLGTCIVIATKAASATNQAASSPATTVRFSVAVPKATHVIGAAWVGRTVTVKIVGSHFYGRPRIVSNAAGVRALVLRDSGRLLTVRVTVNAGAKTGVHTFTVILAKGKRTSVKFNLR